MRSFRTVVPLLALAGLAVGTGVGMVELHLSIDRFVRLAAHRDYVTGSPLLFQAPQDYVLRYTVAGGLIGVVCGGILSAVTARVRTSAEHGRSST